MKITLIKVDCSEVEVVPANGKKLSLEEMQKHVGGYIERVTFKGGEMYVDEDGIAKGLPYNIKASNLAGRDLIGNALVFTRKVREPKRSKV